MQSPNSAQIISFNIALFKFCSLTRKQKHFLLFLEECSELSDDICKEVG